MQYKIVIKKPYRQEKMRALPITIKWYKNEKDSNFYNHIKMWRYS